jgi:site-specific DNA-cytosine methylase
MGEVMTYLVIGGSPCTHWSIAQKNGRETTAEGIGWELFLNYKIAVEKVKALAEKNGANFYFLYENNKSAAEPIKEQIRQELGVTVPSLFQADNGVRFTYINSALVSAQNRQRFYVTNWGDIQQPADRGILLKDILETGDIDGEKSYCLKHQAGNARDHFKKHHTNIAFEPVCEPVRIGDIGSTAQAHRVYSAEGKTVTINSGGGGQGGKTGLYATPIIDRLGGLYNQDTRWGIWNTEAHSPTLTAAMGQGGGHVPMVSNETDDTTISEKNPTDKKQVYEVRNGQITIKGKQYPIKLADGFYIIRKLTVTECARLQTMPDDFCRAVSASQGYRGLGNGWTAEVIIHLLQHAKIPLDDEITVVSMYDGIGTGRYCLDKMGYKNVKYYAYEIDKYAIQIAKSNYPDIVELGDAFQVRQENWEVIK